MEATSCVLDRVVASIGISILAFRPTPSRFGTARPSEPLLTFRCRCARHVCFGLCQSAAAALRDNQFHIIARYVPSYISYHFGTHRPIFQVADTAAIVAWPGRPPTPSTRSPHDGNTYTGYSSN